MSIIQVEIEHSWNIVAKIRDQVRTELNAFSDEVKDAAVMTASELVENAIKHGISTSSCPQVRFFFQYDEKNGNIIIKVANGIVYPSETVNKLIGVVNRIQEAPDKAELYTSRLMELMENFSSGVSQLGLYRIAYEGGFDLSCRLESDTIEVIADRKI